MGALRGCTVRFIFAVCVRERERVCVSHKGGVTKIIEKLVAFAW